MIPAHIQHNPREALVRIVYIPSQEAGAVLLDHTRANYGGGMDATIDRLILAGAEMIRRNPDCEDWG